jgi:hypothetical protein
MAVSKRTRFEVFKRDDFRCRYCGANAMQSLIEVDHVIPASKGGTDDAANLVAACWDCNHGKSDVPLEDRRLSEPTPAEALGEHAKQIRTYLRHQRKLLAAQEAARYEVLNLWCKHSGKDEGPRDILCKSDALLRRFSLADLDRAFAIAFSRGPYSEDRKWRYAQAVLRNWREKAEAAAAGSAVQS